jgi:hypothetical protein
MQQWVYTNSLFVVPEAQENVVFYVIPFTLPNVPTPPATKETSDVIILTLRITLLKVSQMNKYE